MGFSVPITGCLKKEGEMNSKKIVLTAFILVAIVQLAIPGKIIWDRETILETGKEFKFETAPVDPSDPFRGNYIVLDYKENSFNVESTKEWIDGGKVYVILETDTNGFAKISSISRKKPTNDLDFVKAKVDYVIDSKFKKLFISYPFTRFYMEESKAYPAEQAYVKSQVDSTKTTYALVSIKNGDAVLKDVLIDGIPIRDVVERTQAKNQQ